MDPLLPSPSVSHSQEGKGEGLEPVGVPGRPQGQLQQRQVVLAVIINPGHQSLGRKVGRLHLSQGLGEGQEMIRLDSSATTTAPRSSLSPGFTNPSSHSAVSCSSLSFPNPGTGGNLREMVHATLCRLGHQETACHRG